jgi:hypothetical protein
MSHNEYRLKLKGEKPFKELPFERRCAIVEAKNLEGEDPELKSLRKHYQTERDEKVRRQKIAIKVLELRNQNMN